MPQPALPQCQGSTTHRWLEARQVDYYHLVFTLPAPISALAYSNKSVIYTILFKAAAKTLQTIAADPKHLGARLGITLVLHTWGSAMTHHPLCMALSLVVAYPRMVSVG
jgi:hypothetical protein